MSVLSQLTLNVRASDYAMKACEEDFQCSEENGCIAALLQDAYLEGARVQRDRDARAIRDLAEFYMSQGNKAVARDLLKLKRRIEK